MARTFLREGRHLVLRLFGVLGTRAVIAVCLLASVSVTMGAWRNLWMGARGTAVDGVVVRQDETLSADWNAGDQADSSAPRMAAARRLFQAVVEFKAGDKLYQVRARQLGPTHVYPLGSGQVVVYLSDRPEDARLRAELPDMWVQASLLLMGTIVGAGAIKWWWWLAKRRTRFRRRPPAAAPVPAPPADPQG